MKTERLFKITFIILEKKTVTAAELAERFHVSVRTIYRDLDILSACGVPIYTQSGRNGGICMMEQYTLNKTFLTDEEQSQIVMALQSFKATGQEDVAAPLSKLQGIFQKNFDDWIEIDFSSWGNSDEDKRLFSLIRESIRQSKALQIEYVNTKGESSLRTVEPYKLVFKGQSWYLFAYCRLKKDFRFFKLSRIAQPQLCGDTFVKKGRQQFENKDSYKDAYKGRKLSTVRFKADVAAGYRVLDEFRGSIKETTKDGYIIETELEDGPWLVRYLLGFGDAIQIIEPLELKQRYLDLLEKMRKKNE